MPLEYTLGGDPPERAPPSAKGTQRPADLLLPGALLVTIQPQLLAALMLVDFCLTTFFE